MAAASAAAAAFFDRAAAATTQARVGAAGGGAGDGAAAESPADAAARARRAVWEALPSARAPGVDRGDRAAGVPYACNWIGGRAQAPAAAEAAAGGGGGGAPAHALSNIAPAYGEELTLVADSSEEDVDAAVAAARRAGAEWRGWSVDRRCDALVRVADAIVARADDLALLESLDCGKPRQLARVVDVARAEENFRFFASFVRHEAGATPAHLSDGVINYEERSPHGVCALITPWNLPLYLLTWKVAPALAMGNTVVAKPSEWSPLTALALGEIVAEAGIPPGVFNVVHGRGACAGDALVRHPSVKMVSFTGGTVTGRIVGGHCGRLFKRCSLELGGKNAAVVMADADTDLVGRELARAAFLNNGQICLCCERVLVQRAVYDKVRGALVDAARELVVGDPEDSRTQCGPLIHPNQVEKVRRMLQEAADDGATLLCGGGTPAGLPERCQRGCFVAPCVLEGAKQDDRITQNETFGPMTSLQAFDTEEEAIALANGTKYGLAASVFAGDSGAAQRIARAIDAGTVWVNCWLQRDLRVAFGGMKDSGLGREGGHHSLDAFSERRTIVTKH